MIFGQNYSTQNENAPRRHEDCEMRFLIDVTILANEIKESNNSYPQHRLTTRTTLAYTIGTNSTAVARKGSGGSFVLKSNT